MSITKLMGQPVSEIKSLDPSVGFEIFAQKTQQNNHMIEKPAKYQIALPVSIGVILGVSIAYASKNGGSR